jgi:acyl-coenzyme A thioesterase PaaI-like protein
MTEPSDLDPVARARRSTEFFASRVPGQLGCVFDHAAQDLVVGHIDVTENLIAGTGFLSSARVGERVTCRCTPAHLGRQTHVWDAVVSNETTGKVMAPFRCTQMVLMPR